MNDNKDIWFPAKRYGWGWGLPVRWEGVAVLIGYTVLTIVGIGVMAAHRSNILWFALYQLALSAVLFAICLKKGEPPRWRWGGDS